MNDDLYARIAEDDELLTAWSDGWHARGNRVPVSEVPQLNGTDAQARARARAWRLGWYDCDGELVDYSEVQRAYHAGYVARVLGGAVCALPGEGELAPSLIPEWKAGWLRADKEVFGPDPEDF